jgi:hypothetical protein
VKEIRSAADRMHPLFSRVKYLPADSHTPTDRTLRPVPHFTMLKYSAECWERLMNVELERIRKGEVMA